MVLAAAAQALELAAAAHAAVQLKLQA